MTGELTDFDLFLEEICVSAELLNEAKVVAVFDAPTAFEKEHIVLRDSPIEGKGLFAKTAISTHQFLAKGFDDGRWSYTGRYLNHSPLPNVRMLKGSGGTRFESARAIDAGEELTVNYRNVREILSL